MTLPPSYRNNLLRGAGVEQADVPEMTLPPSYRNNLLRFKQFVVTHLSQGEEQVLRLLAIDGLTHKEVADRINRTVKTVERLVSNIRRKYHDFYPCEQDASIRRVLNRAACYYEFADLL